MIRVIQKLAVLFVSGAWLVGVTAWAQPAPTGDTIGRMTEELNECRQGLEVAWSEMEAMKASVRETEAALAAAASENRRLTAELRERNDLLRRLKAAIVQQREQAAELKASSVAADERVSELEAELDRVRQEALGESPDRRTRSLHERVKTLEKELKAQNGEVKKLNAERRSDDKLIKSLEADATKAEARRRDLEADLAAARKAAETQADLVEQRKREIQDLRQAIAARDKLLGKRGGRVSRELRVPDDRAPITRREPAPVRADASSGTASAAPAAPAAPVRDADRPYRLIVEGNRALRAGRVEEAERTFNEALSISPGLTGARLGLAACHYTRANFAAAKQIIEEILREDPRHAQALGLAGIIAWQEGDIDQAWRRIQAAVRLAPNDPELQNYAGIVLHGQGKQEEAVRAMKRAVELDDSYTEALFNLAVLLATQEVPDLDAARTYYEKAIALGSDRDEKLEQILNR